MRVNCIGAGRVGQALLKMLNQAGFTVQGVCNSSHASSIHAIEKIGAGEAFSTPDELPDAEITLITTSDDALHQVARQLSQSLALSGGRVVIHCSGSHDSQILSPLKVKRCQLASVHPMFSFSDPDLSVTNFPGTFCAIEGDRCATKVAQTLFEAIGGETFSIAQDKKALYHAAGVFSSNYVLTLLEQAKKCLVGAGVEENHAMKIVTKLMSSTVSNLMNTLSPSQCLTGPIQRGDSSTVQQHISALEAVDLSKIYKDLGRLTLELAGEKKNERLANLFEV